MFTHVNSNRRAVSARIKRIWAELGYANRRMFAIRSGEYLIRDTSVKESRRAARRRSAEAIH